jgi:hypothetical protein
MSYKTASGVRVEMASPIRQLTADKRKRSATLAVAGTLDGSLRIVKSVNQSQQQQGHTHTIRPSSMSTGFLDLNGDVQIEILNPVILSQDCKVVKLRQATDAEQLATGSTVAQQTVRPAYHNPLALTHPRIYALYEHLSELYTLYELEVKAFHINEGAASGTV